MHKYNSNWDGVQRNTLRNLGEQFKAGDKVKVPHKGRMVSGKIVRFDSGGTDKARQHGGGYVVDVGEPASIVVPKEKVQKESVQESWGGGFQSAADAHRQVQAGLKADFQRERAQKLKLIVQVIRGEISKQKFKKLTGSNFDDLMKYSPYFRNQVKRMPKKALEPVKPVKEEVDISEGMTHFTELDKAAKDIIAIANQITGGKHRSVQEQIKQIAVGMINEHHRMQEFFKGLLMNLEEINKKAASPSRHGNMEIMRDMDTVIRELKKYQK